MQKYDRFNPSFNGDTMIEVFIRPYLCYEHNSRFHLHNVESKLHTFVSKSRSGFVSVQLAFLPITTRKLHPYNGDKKCDLLISKLLNRKFINYILY